MEYEDQAARLGGFIKASKEKPGSNNTPFRFFLTSRLILKSSKVYFNRRKTPRK